MQIDFYANKSTVVKIFDYLEKNFEEVVIADPYKNRFFSKENVLNMEVKDTDLVYITYKNSPLYNLIVSNELDGKTYDEIYYKCNPLVEICSILFYIGIASEEVYDFDFTDYNPNNSHYSFAVCGLQTIMYYASHPDLQPCKGVYKKLVRYIKKHAVVVNSIWTKSTVVKIDD